MNTLEKFKQVHTIMLDVDGVLTNGKVIITEKGELIRSMNIKDGYAMKAALASGLKIMVITGGKYFDLSYLSPYTALNAIQLSFPNIEIERVEMLLNNYTGDLYHTNKSIGILSFVEDLVPRNQQWTNLARVYYTDHSDQLICPQEVTLVNEFLEEIQPIQTNCLSTSSVLENGPKETEWSLFPNPNQGTFSLFNKELLNDPYQLVILDVRGNIVFSEDGWASQLISLNLSGIASGIYHYRIYSNGKTQVGRFSYFQ